MSFGTGMVVLACVGAACWLLRQGIEEWWWFLVLAWAVS